MVIANNRTKKNSMKKITLFFLSITICSALSMQTLLPDTLMQQIKDMGLLKEI
jgi:hypothetical protein